MAKRLSGATAENVGIKVGGKTRFPDILLDDGIQEAKNVAAIGSRDAKHITAYASYSVQRGLQPVTVFTRPNTNVKAIQTLIDSGLVKQQFLPGINNAGVYAITRGEAFLTGLGAGSGAIVRGKPQK